jgi:hypothetical protein
MIWRPGRSKLAYVLDLGSKFTAQLFGLRFQHLNSAFRVKRSYIRTWFPFEILKSLSLPITITAILHWYEPNYQFHSSRTVGQRKAIENLYQLCDKSVSWRLLPRACVILTRRLSVSYLSFLSYDWLICFSDEVRMRFIEIIPYTHGKHLDPVHMEVLVLCHPSSKSG